MTRPNCGPSLTATSYIKGRAVARAVTSNAAPTQGQGLRSRQGGLPLLAGTLARLAGAAAARAVAVILALLASTGITGCAALLSGVLALFVMTALLAGMHAAILLGHDPDPFLDWLRMLDQPLIAARRSTRSGGPMA